LIAAEIAFVVKDIKCDGLLPDRDILLRATSAVIPCIEIAVSII
jgi:hypothetical protein